MKEYGIGITNHDGDKITVYFMPMSYIDWKTYFAFESRYDLPSVRYLIHTYTSRAYKIANNEETELSVIDIINLDPAPLNKIIDMMFEKAGFNDEKSIQNVMEKAETHSRTLVGMYDRFILIHGGIEMYISMLEQNVHVRSNVISALEIMTNVSVANRFNDSIANDIPIDIVTPKEKYDNMNRRRNKGQHVPVPDQSIPGHDGTDQDVPTDMKELAEASRAALHEQLKSDKEARTKRKVAFDWMRDEQDYATHNRKEDRHILDKDRMPDSGG